MLTSCERRKIDRFNRRSLLKGGSAAVGAFALPGLIHTGAGQAVAEPKIAGRAAAQQAIVILLQGGCSHLDNLRLGFDDLTESD